MAGSAIRALGATTALVVVVGAGQANAVDESRDLSSDVARLQAELEAVTAERDALREEAAARAERHRRSSAVQQTIIDIIADPTALGSEEAVLDLLDALADPNATMDDIALGTVAWREAWRGTLFGAQADIRTWAKWMADDGSIGGSLWTWSGAAFNGEPFSLPGIDISTYDEAGRTISAVVHWPYEQAEVECVVSEGNQACALTDG